MNKKMIDGFKYFLTLGEVTILQSSNEEVLKIKVNYEYWNIDKKGRYTFIGKDTVNSK
jgi:hypothetical protein